MLSMICGKTQQDGIGNETIHDIDRSGKNKNS